MAKLSTRLYLIEGYEVDECGDTDYVEPQEGVSMEVSIKGNGADSIRSLMDILKGIENGTDTSDTGGDDFLLGDPEDDSFGGDDSEFDLGDDDEFNLGDEDDDEENKFGVAIIGDDYGNSMRGASGRKTFGIGAITPKGDDLSSKGREAPKQAGGGNPWNQRVSETLVNRLTAMYEEIGTRNQTPRKRRRG